MTQRQMMDNQDDYAGMDMGDMGTAYFGGEYGFDPMANMGDMDTAYVEEAMSGGMPAEGPITAQGMDMAAGTRPAETPPGADMVPTTATP